MGVDMEFLPMSNNLSTHQLTRASSLSFSRHVFQSIENNVGDLIAVLVPHHDVIVAPDSCLGNSVEQRRARKLGQRKVDGVSTCRVDLAVCVKARPGVRPADLIDAMDAERGNLGQSITAFFGWELQAPCGSNPIAALKVPVYRCPCGRRLCPPRSDRCKWLADFFSADNPGSRRPHRPFGNKGSEPVLITFRIKGWHLIAIAVHGRIVGIARIIADAAWIIRTV